MPLRVFSPHRALPVVPAVPSCVRPCTCRQQGEGGIWRVDHRALQLRAREPTPGRPSRGGVVLPPPQGVRLTRWSLASLRPWRRAGWELEGTPGPPRAGAGSACGLLLSWMHGAGNPWLPFPAPVPVRNCARQARDQSRHLAFIGNPPRSAGNQRVWQPLRSPWLPYRWSGEGQFCAEGPVLPLECSVHSSAHL